MDKKKRSARKNKLYIQISLHFVLCDIRKVLISATLCY